jgi:3-phosphoshikimate 1-carboxyvinyltransferase
VVKILKTITPRSHINAVVEIPGSKSITHRALIAAALAQGESHLAAFLKSEDTLFTLEALRKLQIPIDLQNDQITVSGCGGVFAPNPVQTEIFLGNSGTSYRLLLSIIALAKGSYLIKGSDRMHERPIGDLLQSLKQLKVEVQCLGKEGFPPVLIRAKGLKGGRVQLAGRESSQYISSLLLAGPYAEKDLEIEVLGDPVSKPYIDITLGVMQDFGIRVEREGYRYFKVKSGRPYQARSYTIEGDASSASYFWAAAAVTGGQVTTKNIAAEKSFQGDMAFLDILQKMGCRVEKETRQVTIKGAGLKGLEVDMGSMPDMVPTLAAVALFAQGQTVIRNVAHLRIKESDRLGSVAQEWRKLGACIEEQPDGLLIQGPATLHGAAVDPHNDHRLAMSLAVIGLRVPGVRIQNKSCVGKSFPNFWEIWETL